MIPSFISADSVTPGSSARAADGDFKTKGIGHEVKDSDGDYKSTKAAPSVQTTSSASAAVNSSSAVRSALIDLPKGGV